MAKGSDGERLVIRMPKELREWIDAQAKEIGLDAASWVKMRLTQQMRGKPASSMVIGNPSALLSDTGYAGRPAPAEPVDPATLDALIDEGLAAADAQGLTVPVESSDDPPQSETMRIGEPSRSTMRNLVGNGSIRPW